MTVTVLAALVIMLAYFLLLYGAVGFVQDRRLFTTAPKVYLERIPEKIPERFPGAHAVGWAIIAAAVLLFAGAFVFAAADGMRNGFGFMRFFGRFLFMLWAMETYDICFFDWVLLCHSGFFPHFFPVLKEVVGPQVFGYNKKEHLIHYIVYVPVCAALALVCTLL